MRFLRFYAPGEGGGSGGDGGGAGDGAGDEGKGDDAGKAGGGGGDKVDRIPKERLDRESAARRAAEAEAAKLRAEIDALKGGEKDAALKTAQETAAKALEQVAALTERVTLAAEGVTDAKHLRYLRSEYEDLGDDKPATLAEYARTVRAAKPADRPAALRGFYGENGAAGVDTPKSPTQPAGVVGTRGRTAELQALTAQLVKDPRNTALREKHSKLLAELRGS